MPLQNYDRMIHSINIDVQWSDMDAYQHVNNRHYLLWLETARIDLASKYFPDECHFIIARVAIDYHFPVVFPDTVCCQSHVSKLGNSSCELTTTITSKTHEKLCATAQVVIVNYDYKALASTRWSDSERTALKQFM